MSIMFDQLALKRECLNMVTPNMQFKIPLLINWLYFRPFYEIVTNQL